MDQTAAIYVGSVVHKRLRPKPHALKYAVFALLVDVDAIGATCARLKCLAHNTTGLFSLHDRDHGAGDGTPIAEIARDGLRAAGRPVDGRRILLLTYPRVLGYVFNPLSVFFVYAPDGTLESLIYEVSNTFGERKSYVLAAGHRQQGGVHAQSCAKEMYVSPFTDGSGRYGFRITDPDKTTVVAVLYSDGDGALLKTHFRADRRPLTDAALMRLAFRFPALGFKVMAAIHYEALKLWLKGVPLTVRHDSPRYSTSPVLDKNQG
jgi:uncharacterized protein